MANPSNSKSPNDKVEDFAKGVLSGDRTILAKAITLIESDLPEHIEQGQKLLAKIYDRTSGAIRLGISGVPGVGKSTFIDAFGSLLTAQNKKIAVLAIDPSSAVSRGSILGDKTRMSKLSRDPNAFIRPSPTGGTLGGVTRKTRESMLLCEAAGFDVVIVETVGVGQSETVVSHMVDYYLVLMLAGAGDDLQGIKRGILEIADMLAINKADGENKIAAENAKRDYQMALHIMRGHNEIWNPPVLTCSAVEKTGLSEIWENIETFMQKMNEQNSLQKKRQQQKVRWLWDTIESSLFRSFTHHPDVQSKIKSMEEQVRTEQIIPTTAANELLKTFFEGKKSD